MRTAIRRHWRTFTGSAVCVATVVVIVATSGLSSAANVRPRQVSELPRRIPSGGVVLNHLTVFLPPTTVRHGISKAEAIKLGDQQVNPGFARTVIEADVRQKFAPWLGRYPAWVVVFTSRTPIDVSAGPPGSPPAFVTHNILIFNRRTGRFVVGLFTK